MIKVFLFAATDLVAWFLAVRDLQKWRATKIAEPTLVRGLVLAVAGLVAVVVLVVRSSGA